MSILDFFRTRSKNPLNVTSRRGQENLYELLDEYYNNNFLYEYGIYNNIYTENMKGLRTAVHRSVEFYSSHIATDIAIVTENMALKSAIEQFHDWSNFEDVKRRIIRHFALYGDVFLKIVNDEDKIYFQEINPKNVVDIDTDDMGNIIELKIVTPVEVDEKNLTRIEKWEKKNGIVTMSVWFTNMGVLVDTDTLGQPQEFIDLSAIGISFIPIVHAMFSDFGDKRGIGCATHALLKVDDLNRQATRIEEILFRYNKPLWAVSSNSNDANGRPIPAPKINVGGTVDSNIDMKDSTMMYLPGNASLTPIIPNINYGDALKILESMSAELECDLPEIRYYSVKDTSMSGRAIRNILQGAIDKGTEAQSNLLNQIEKLDKMAIEMGIIFGIFPSNLANDMEHELDGGEIFPQDPLEMSQTLTQLVSAGIPLEIAMRKVGFTELEISQSIVSTGTDNTPQETNVVAG